LLVYLFAFLANAVLVLSAGRLVGIYSASNNLTVVGIDETTGVVTTLVNLGLDLGYIYDSACTSDKSIYYCGLLGTDFSGWLVSVDVQSRTLLGKVATPLPWVTLGFDQTMNKIFGLAFDSKEQIPQLFSIDPTSLVQTRIGLYPAHFIPNDNGGAYDSANKVMIARMTAAASGSTHLIGMSTAGRIVYNTIESTSSIYFTTDFDSVKRRVISVAQNYTGSEDYYLAVIDVATGAGAPISPRTSFSSGSFYPTVTAISPVEREFYLVMNSNNAISFNVISLDTGVAERTVTPWNYEPVDITYVTW